MFVACYHLTLTCHWRGQLYAYEISALRSGVGVKLSRLESDGLRLESNSAESRG